MSDSFAAEPQAALLPSSEQMKVRTLHIHARENMIKAIELPTLPKENPCQTTPSFKMVP